MNNFCHNLPIANRVLFETNELILSVRQDQIYYAEIIGNDCIQISGQSINCFISNENKSVVIILLKAGFMRINTSYYINPRQISEYYFKEKRIVLNNGTRLKIGRNYMKYLSAFFANNSTI